MSDPMPDPMIVIGREDVARHLDMAACIGLMRDAMAALSQGRTRQLLRQIIDFDDGNAFGVMPGAIDDLAFGAKLVSVYPANFARGVQSHQGVLALFDPASGAPVSMIHAGEVTAIRTAAASAAATDALARADAHRLAILGYGEQAWQHAVAMRHVRPISHIAIWGRSPERAAAFAARVSAELGLPATAAPDVATAVADADIVCTVTAASQPILFSDQVRDGTHLNIVGSSRAGPVEIDGALVARARLFADHRESVLRQGAEVINALESGLISEDHVQEIGQVYSGALHSGTTKLTANPTIYKSLGSIVQDLAAGWHLYRLARERGFGTAIPAFG
ncbi:ornithine cyclodeaminase [Sphingomonas laterariae]|uniref:Ornithine cyclodeaminase n=1 Tax=Edaphosphingomonas laterariae TaxID=861865 RepID=A0A239BWW3_9SPHN|nr:ornithine cyclodeaminase family protein [Sphingomonas laterariae]SNS12507.1 ornithine cyclodeaminase [Sphingomonas laterariae]